VSRTVYVGSSTGTLRAFDTSSGALVWSTAVGAAIPLPDEQKLIQPLTGLGAAQGTLILPAGTRLVAFH
jgi:outer membrane protein assembly factor BamB